LRRAAGHDKPAGKGTDAAFVAAFGIFLRVGTGQQQRVGRAIAVETQLLSVICARDQLTFAVGHEGVICSHPFAKTHKYWDYRVPLLDGDHVTDEQGTGFVHTAPGHGAEDYVAWMANKIWHDPKEPIPHTVGPDGAYLPHIPLFAGLEIVRTEGKKAGQDGPANKAVVDTLIEAGNLLARGRLEHSYPHSWRSKAPVIFRNTNQWFIAIDRDMGDGTTLRERALEAIDATEWTPKTARNRIHDYNPGAPGAAFRAARHRR